MSATLTITLDGARAHVSGPVHDPALCEQLLRAGAECLKQHFEKARQPTVEVATVGQLRTMLAGR